MLKKVKNRAGFPLNWVFGVILTILLFHPMQESAAKNSAQNGVLVGKDVELRSLIEAVAIRTGRVFVVDPQVSGTATINAGPDISLTPEETWEIFLAALQVGGYAVTPIGKNEYKVVPNEIIRKQAGSGFSIDSDNGTVTRIVRLNFIDALDVSSNLGDLTSEYGTITPIADSNALIIVDNAANVQRLVEVVRRIDSDRSVVRTIELKNAAAGEVATILTRITQEQSDTLEIGILNIVTVESNNSIILHGLLTAIEKLIPVIDNLDRQGLQQSDLSVIYLKHANSDELAVLLKEAVGAPSSTVEGATSGAPSIVSDKQTNSLIINADAKTQRTIRSIVTQLDIRRAQVLIEAIIVNISDDAARDLGIQYILTGNGSNTPFISNSSSNGSPNILAAAASAFLLNETQEEGTTTTVNANGITTTTDNGQRSEIPGTSGIVDNTIRSLLNANGLIVGGGGRRSDGSVYGAILTAIQSDTNSRVLSTPSLMTLDNQKARLQVGQEIPVTSGEALGNDLNNSFRTVEREEIGVILEVTPQISSGETIKLEIMQEVSSVQSAVQTTNTDFITNKSTISNSVLAEDGQILVLGGLIDNSEERTETKVPLLGDIPIAGNLFKQSGKDERKNTLLVFIRPTIIRNAETSSKATARKYDYARNELRKFRRTKKSEIDEIVTNYLGIDTGLDDPPDTQEDNNQTPESETDESTALPQDSEELIFDQALGHSDWRKKDIP